MTAEADQGLWAAGIATAGAVLGCVGTVIGHIIRSRASMSAMVDSRIKLLIDEDRNRIEELQAEIKRLEDKIDFLTGQLEDAGRALEKCTECGKWIAPEGWASLTTKRQRKPPFF